MMMIGNAGDQSGTANARRDHILYPECADVNSRAQRLKGNNAEDYGILMASVL